MSALATREEVIDVLTIEIRTAEARLEHATDAYIVQRYRDEIRAKRSAVVLLGGADPTIPDDKIEALQ